MEFSKDKSLPKGVLLFSKSKDTLVSAFLLEAIGVFRAGGKNNFFANSNLVQIDSSWTV